MIKKIAALAAGLMLVVAVGVGDAKVLSPGRSMILHGFEGLKMRVTVLDVVDPVDDGSCYYSAQKFDDVSTDNSALRDALAKAQYACLHPGTGERNVGVMVRLTNAGTTEYEDSPSNGASLRTRAGKRATSTILTEGDCDSDWASHTEIAPGKSETGCIPFHIKKGRAGVFTFTLNSGFADETGRWTFAPRH